MNISSIVIQVKPQNYDELKQNLEDSPLCDWFFGDKDRGKMVIVIEAEDVGKEVKKLVEIQSMPYVLSADMMQTYQEELHTAIDKLEQNDRVPPILNDESTDIRDIVYNGDLKKMDFMGGI